MRIRYSEINEKVKKLEEEVMLLKGEVLYAKPALRVKILSDTRTYVGINILLESVQKLREEISGGLLRSQ